MRVSRVYIAGIGTTGVIVAATVLTLAVVSTLVAFRGLPTQDVPAPIRSYIVEGPSEPPRPAVPDRSAPDVAGAAAGSRAPAPPAAPVEAGPPATGTAAGEGSLSGREPAPRRDAPTPTDPDRGDGPGTDPGVPEAPTPGSPQVPPTGLELLTRSLGDTTARVTRALGGVLAPVSPSLGASVAGAGEALSHRLRELGASN